MLAARNADYLAEVQKEIEARGGRALAVPTNLVDAEQVDALVDAHRRRVRAASTSSSTTRSAWTRASRSSRSTSTNWRKIFEVNVWGALGLTQACVPHLKESRGRARRRVDRVHHLDEHAQDPPQRGRLLDVEGRACAPRRRRWRSSSARRASASTASRRAGSADRTSRCSSRWESRARGIPTDDRARRDRGAHPARTDPAAGRHRELGRVLRLAVVAVDHRPDARRQRRRVVRLNARR